jgi:hypothetical protein
MLQVRFVFVAIFGLVAVRAYSVAQDATVSDKSKDQVFECYAATLDNAQRIHQLGFRATVIFDIDADEITHPTPIIYRRYGMIADVANGKSRRIENVGWTIRDTGTKWEQGARLIVNDVGAFYQEDPAAITKIDKAKVTPDFRVHAQAMYSPFGLLWSPHSGTGLGQGDCTLSHWLNSTLSR